MNDWWQRKLSGHQQPQGHGAFAPRPQAPQVVPTATGQYPAPQQAPVAYQAAPQQRPDKEQLLHAAKTGRISWLQAADYWDGGQACATQNTACPECGEPLLSRGTEVSRGPQPAPVCFCCGWNGGMFRQGDPAMWNATA